MRPVAALALCAPLALLASACLPADDRPEPGSVLVNVQRSTVATGGFVTDDGWSMSFDRFVTDIGNMSLQDNDCSDYSLAHYDRLWDFAKADFSKASLHYGLGQCTIEFSIGTPSEQAILMGGVTQADLTVMRTEDPSIPDGEGPRRVALMVIGRGEKDGVTKRFSWLIHGRYRVGVCHTPARDQDLSTIQLNGGDSFERELVVRPEELFRLTPSYEARIEFGRFAAADANGDGSITMDELAKVPVSVDQIAADLADEIGGQSADRIASLIGTSPTLASLVSNILAWRIVAFAGSGECDVGERPGFSFFGG